MTTALIGYTGFVGGTLLRQRPFEHCYNSSNIEEIRGHDYDLVVCAGAPGRKWEANQLPDRDQASLARLMRALEHVRATNLVLISTVDVYPVPIDVDESVPIDAAACSPYGRHRYLLEQFVADHFSATIVRLPGLFGRGLKKNIIYDFLHDNRTDAISADSTFQFYDLANLWRDIERCMSHRLPLLNLATEPVSVRTVAERAFGKAFVSRGAFPPVRYDFHSRFADRMGARNPYLYRQDEVLEAMTRFVRDERAS